MIQTFDCRSEYLKCKTEIDVAIQRVLNSGQLILGPEVEAFEAEFAAYVGASAAVGVGSGTDALILALRALEVGAGDEVITVANTAVPTISAIRAVGAIPRFVDVCPETLLIDPDQVSAAIGPCTRCILPVHLYGLPADMSSILGVARQRGIPIVADCAQAHGARIAGRHVGTFADIGCFSFYPTKNLGAFGDGGICTTNNAGLAARIRSLRCFGFEDDRIAHRDGICSRLDELQAAILRVRLRRLDAILETRRRLAAMYSSLLQGSRYVLPPDIDDAQHAFHQYVIRSPRRELLTRKLQQAGIGYGIHYPVPIHRMPAYEWLDCRSGELPVTERAATEILSLPLHSGLEDGDIRQVAEVLLAAAPAGLCTSAAI